MECDVAVLGGGPGGLHGRDPRRAARRQGRLHRAGARARRHLPARRLHPDEGLGADRARAQDGRARRSPSSASSVGEPQLDFAPGGRVEGRRRQADDRRRRRPASRRTASSGCKGTGRFTDANTIAVEGGEDVTFKSAIVATGSYPDASADRGPRLAALRRLDRPARADRGAAPARRPRRRHHRLRVRLDLQPLRQRGDDRRDAADADPAGGRGRGEGAREAVRASAASRSTSRSSAPKVEDTGDALDRALRRRRDGRGRPDARRGRPRPARRGPRARGDRRRARPAQGDRRPTSTGARRSRTSTPSATAPATGSSRTPRSARARSRPRTRWATRPSSATAAVPRPIYTDPGDRRRRPDRGAGARAVRRRRRRRRRSRGSRTRAR